MALTPEDVVKKEFTKPKGFGRSGYDEIQVDDFLDEIVVELRRLNAENEDLGAKLDDARRAKGLTGREAAPAAATGASAVPGLTPVGGASSKDAERASAELSQAQDRLASVKAETARAEESARAAKDAQQQAEVAARQAQERLNALKAEIDNAEGAARAARQRAEQESARPAEVNSFAAQQAPAASGNPGDDTAAGVIALAQRLHDEHVREGETARTRLITEGEQHRDKVVGEASGKRDELLRTGQSRYDELLRTGQAKYDELVSTAQNKHDSLIKDATTRSNALVGDAETKKSTILTQLNTERDRLTSDIEQLRTFERDYRSKLKGYIEGQLKQLDHTTIDGEQPKDGASKA